MARNSDIEFISKDDLKNILQDSIVSNKEIQAIFRNNINTAQTLKKMCKLYTKLLESKNRVDQNNAYVLGANIIFNLRKFITGQDINLLEGAITPNTHYQLEVGVYPITELLKNPSNYKITDKGFEVIMTQLKNLEDDQYKLLDDDRDKVWEKIMEATDINGTNDFHYKKASEKADATSHDSKNNEIRLFKRRRWDNRIYYSYKANKTAEGEERNINEKAYSYYDMGKQDFQYFNNGWLFERFMSKWMNATIEQKAVISDMFLGKKRNGVLRIFMGKGDTIEGIKGGDFRSDGIEYQAKYGNPKIISLINIRETITKIQEFLSEYAKDNNLNNLYKNFARLFTDPRNMSSEEKTLKMTNEEYEDILDEMIAPLTKINK